MEIINENIKEMVEESNNRITIYENYHPSSNA